MKKVSGTISQGEKKKKVSGTILMPAHGLSEAAIPLSMIAAMTSGTISSKDASSSLNSGAQMHSFLYSFKYFNICFIFSPSRFLLLFTSLYDQQQLQLHYYR